MPVLRLGHVKAVLPDAAALPGWKNSTKPVVTTDRFLCQGVFANGCRGTVALGSADFARGRKTPQEWVRLGFSLYSCSSERAAHDLYTSLDLGGTKLALAGSLGDERLATREKAGEASVLNTKVRTGTTVLWVVALGSKQTATNERVEKALQLLYDRTQEAKTGAKPTTSVSIT